MLQLNLSEQWWAVVQFKKMNVSHFHTLSQSHPVQHDECRLTGYSVLLPFILYQAYSPMQIFTEHLIFWGGVFLRNCVVNR